MRVWMGAMIGMVLLATADAQTTSPLAIPPSAPTQSVSNLPSAQPVTKAGSNTIRWNGAVLSVNGGGDSLRNILRQVARATGMKVTGGVPDEPVFGSYGPAPVQQVMTALFNGLSVNMMLVNDSPTQPKELVLTARTGGPTPPAPAQPLNTADDPAEVNLAQPRPGRHTSPDSFGNAPTQNQPTQNQPTLTGGGPAVPLTDSTTGSTTDANGQPQSPNGVRTPEQIFEELRKRQVTNAAP